MKEYVTNESGWKLEVRNYGKKVQDGKTFAPPFKYSLLPAEQLAEWGVPETAAAHLDFIQDRYLRTHPLKQRHLVNWRIVNGTTEATAAERKEAELEMEEVYSLDWESMPQLRKESKETKEKKKWGDLYPYIEMARGVCAKQGLESPEDDDIRVVARKLKSRLEDIDPDELFA